MALGGPSFSTIRKASAAWVSMSWPSAVWVDRSWPRFALANRKSGEVQGETLEIGERTMIEGTFVSSPQDHVGRATRLQCFDPAGRAQAPAVAGPEAGKAELGQGRRKIIAARIGKLEKLGRNDDAH